MTKEEYYGIDGSEIMYDDRDNVLRRNTGCWPGDHTPEDDDEILVSKITNRRDKKYIKLCDIDHWHFLSDDSPDTIKLQHLKYKFDMLENFVHTRLH